MACFVQCFPNSDVGVSEDDCLQRVVHDVREVALLDVVQHVVERLKAGWRPLERLMGSLIIKEPQICPVEI